ncbi:HPF/RaiA family ribosome-associated protein [Magnetovibrio sp.]|uniref:HPF/RaiA family ribosome-associated protein n=1 Tax=Magnetovibrio sp. TaxID=2024836 RepID=UPI002F93F042
MQVPVQISFHGCDHSNAVESEIFERIDKIESQYGRITSCRVVVELPHKSQAQGKLFHFNIDMTVPGAGHIVHNDRGQDPAHEDVHVALRDAFNAVDNQLKKVVGKRRDEQRKAADEEMLG